MLERSLGGLGPLSGILCGLIALAAFAGVYSLQARMSAQASLTSSWPTCQGAVKSVYKERTGTTCVEYDYRVNGKDYSSYRVYYDQLGTGTKLADGEYADGQQVLVHYDPKAPEKSVLRLGTCGAKGGEATYAVGILMGIALCFAGLKKMTSKKKALSI
ncbi:MAG TPA: DUF3592 domain-containing protein [Chroococcales cyanobacterium]